MSEETNLKQFLFRSRLVLHERLDLTTSADEGCDKARQHSLPHFLGGWFWDLPFSLQDGILGQNNGEVFRKK